MQSRQKATARMTTKGIDTNPAEMTFVYIEQTRSGPKGVHGGRRGTWPG